MTSSHDHFMVPSGNNHTWVLCQRIFLGITLKCGYQLTFSNAQLVDGRTNDALACFVSDEVGNLRMRCHHGVPLKMQKKICNYEDNPLCSVPIISPG